MLFFFFSCSGDHRDLHSFPTRRSSDLAHLSPASCHFSVAGARNHIGARLRDTSLGGTRCTPDQSRSEEHTSELQSPVHLVCRLLLEKKKLHRLRNYLIFDSVHHGRNMI